MSHRVRKSSQDGSAPLYRVWSSNVDDYISDAMPEKEFRLWYLQEQIRACIEKYWADIDWLIQTAKDVSPGPNPGKGRA